MTSLIDRRISVAPMMDWTDRHDRYFLRLISKHALLYTEMITTGALIHGDTMRFLRYDQSEHPIACQLGGSDPKDLALCAKMVEDAGYNEVNINVGCPSDRVQNGRFGACLMAEPDLVADCVRHMRSAVDIPVTVKTRIGIDDNDSYEALHHFLSTVKEGGCDTFIIHARKAWLKGLSPRENREVPPLRYDVVYRLKQDFPELTIVLNGGVQSIDAVRSHLDEVDGVMLGRTAYQQPYFLADIERQVFANQAVLSREEVLEQFIPYVLKQASEGVYLSKMTRHILGLYLGLPGARKWRRYLSEQTRFASCGRALLESAMSAREQAAKQINQDAYESR